MDEIEYLRAIIDGYGRGHPHGRADRSLCQWCNGDLLIDGNLHSRDCPWLAAKKLLEEHDKAIKDV